MAFRIPSILLNPVILSPSERASMSLIVTGAVGIDRIETPTGSADEVVGGSGIYFPAAASYFTRPRIVSVVGEDFPDAFVAMFDRFDIDTAGLERRRGSKTFRWHGRYHDDMNHRDTLGLELGVLTEAPPAVPESYRDSKYVFLAVDQPSNQLALLDTLPDRELAVMDTIDLYIDTQRDAVIDVIGKVDGVIFNDSEAMALTGTTNAVAAAEAIAAMGPAFVIVKKGEHGAIARHRDGWIALPAYPSNAVVDPTGAGDSFAGAMMGHLAATGGDVSLSNLKKALAYGTVVASYNIEDFSLGRMLDLKREEIDTRYDEFTAMLSA
jgi:sugar/nucleoside kinase (ribokinase family)